MISQKATQIRRLSLSYDGKSLQIQTWATLDVIFKIKTSSQV